MVSMDKPFVCFNCGVIIKNGLYCDDCKGIELEDMIEVNDDDV